MKILFFFLLMTLTGPIWMILFGGIDFNADYRTANRESTHIAPLPQDNPEAIIQVYSARAFNWRGIFAMHMWIAMKPKNASQYTIYQVIGWRTFRGLPALSIAADIPDRLWFNQKPKIIYDIRGSEAEKLIPKVETAVKHYPYSSDYLTWPGPNSNTFVAYIGREVPEMQLVLPSNALGKDFTGFQFVTKTPSGTGYQISLYGYLGIMLALKEGLEINLLGLVYGISLSTLSIKLPGFGDLSAS
ncbi:MAG TPA: DUF3750 domain-containing protein [Gammaproteobacteria bacterium]|jgi:hypothetical protein|nr:DUF3750 domain-containing protein [Gammaproteobacteria bacterium]